MFNIFLGWKKSKKLEFLLIKEQITNQKKIVEAFDLIIYYLKKGKFINDKKFKEMINELNFHKSLNESFLEKYKDQIKELENA